VKYLLAIALALPLAGCLSTEEQLQQLQQADAAACRAMPNIPLETCMAQRMQYRIAAEQMQQAQQAEFGRRLQAAGAAMQQAGQPPVTTNCHMIGGMMQCHTF
jgi:starvation-inducible outer membrane lipoprotein